MVLKGMLINVKRVASHPRQPLTLLTMAYRSLWEETCAHPRDTAMKKSKNIMILALMISSLLLLVILQVFWLKSSYERAYMDFRGQTNMVFRSTVDAMRDSMFMRNVEPVPWRDSLKSFLPFPGHRLADGVINHIRVDKRTTRVQVYVSATSSDSLAKDDLRPLASTIQAFQGKGQANAPRSFIIRLEADSLNLDTLSTKYALALYKEGLSPAFNLRHLRTPPMEDFDNPVTMLANRSRRNHHGSDRDHLHESMFRDSLWLDPVRVTPLFRYGGVIVQVRAEIIRQITLPMLFSAGLTLITAAAFFMMYRNMRTQQRLMAAKNDFINNVTHELKTPVATVSVALEALQNFNAIDNPELTREYLGMAQRELDRLSMMTDNILRTAVLEQEGVVFAPESMDIKALLQQVLDSLKLIFEKRAATIHLQVSGENFLYTGSRMHLTSVLFNLLDNALKYSPGKPVINIQLEATATAITLSVADQGMGIPTDYHHKVYEKFFRVPTGDVHNIKGHGLGLSYVQQVVTRHGGQIQLTSAEGQGSTFTITFPRTTPLA